MVNTEQLILRDRQHIWHPCTQMKELEHTPLLVIEKAKGSILYTNQGPLIDAISSWWCKSLGHGHDAIISAITKQMSCFEHVISANTTHPALVELGEQLAHITKKQHVFFASDGSCAIEIAMKLCMHAMKIKGFADKKQFIALKNAYHGETLGALSVSDLGLYKTPYEGLGIECTFIEPPYVSSMQDPLWSDCATHWATTELQLEAVKEKACAILVEPIIQGAAGMKCYSADFLKRLAQWAKKNDIYLIADEIMTGWGRTGQWLASQHASIEADLICLSKGLTSGSIPFSCVMIDHAVFDLFYSDESSRSFLHSHTYSGNPLAISAALATIHVMQQERIPEQAARMGNLMLNHLQAIAKTTGKISQVRGIGAVVAAELETQEGLKIDESIYKEALKLGALLRPIGNTLYWLPPLNSDDQLIENLAEITQQAIYNSYLCT
ncbi:MAG: adenosylmethionine--8-amino-7-oxononanoate transaminase [Legionella sp.]|nr:MAG: adenosylmethionine--8-amino-7-oxononanoate transaminase [Legionella sp.]PJD99028.1 MAG: adenosylmethionine--8-amino-7-oxononanoate transaminase [Legionella sp.]